jgi:hypothetical protein
VADVRRKPLPDAVGRNREIQRERDTALRKLYEPALEDHIAAHAIALNFLDERLQWIADNTDLDLTGDTRHAAAWQMCGRIVGIARLMLDALRLGYTAELLHLARAVHEADRLLFVFQIPEEADLVKPWLADEVWVRPKATREAEDRFELRLAEAMKKAGIPELRRTKEISEDIYEAHSEAAHHRRRWTQDAVFPDLRTMIRGNSDYWLRRVATVAAMLPVVEEAGTSVGDSLATFFFGADWFTTNIKPLQASFEAMRQAHPLP